MDDTLYFTKMWPCHIPVTHADSMPCHLPKHREIQRRNAILKFTLLLYAARKWESMVLKFIMAGRLIITLSTRSTGLAIQLAGDGVGNVGQLLLLLLEVLGVGSSGYH